MWERQTGSLLCSEWVLPGSSGEAAGLECAADRQNENKKVINMIHQDALVQPNPYWKDCAVHSRQSLALQLAYAPPAIVEIASAPSKCAAHHVSLADCTSLKLRLSDDASTRSRRRDTDSARCDDSRGSCAHHQL